MELTEQERKEHRRLKQRRNEQNLRDEKKKADNDRGTNAVKKGSKGKSKARLKGMNDDFIDDEQLLSQERV